MKNLITKVKLNYQIIIACAVVATVCCLFAGFLVNKGFAPTEGWYSYYAYRVNEEGAIPYKDIELCFPPLYLDIIVLFTKIFGYNIIGLRILGVLIFALIGIFACLILNLLFKNSFIALVGAIIFAAFLQSEVVQIFYDYIRFLDISVLISIYFMLRFLNNLPKYQKFKLDANLIVSTCFATFAALFKQSSGLVFLLFTICMLLFVLIFAKNKKVVAINLAIYIGVYLLINSIMFVILAIKGSLKNYFYYNFTASTAAKGGVKTILFSNLVNTLKASLKVIPSAIILLTILIVYYFVFAKKDDGIKLNKKPKIILLLVLGAISVTLLLLSFSKSVNGKLLKSELISVDQMMQLAFIFSSLAFVAITIAFIARRNKVDITQQSNYMSFMFAYGSSFALNYAVIMSAGLATSQAALSLVLLICSLLSMFKINEVTVFILCLIMSIFPNVMFASKIKTLYSWWGVDIGSYWQQKYKIENNSILDGIYVNKSYYDMYNDILNISKQNVKGEESNQTTFFFPHIPIFYLYTNTTHSTFTSLQWPDVSLDKSIKDDIEVLKQNPPKLIVMCEVPEYVITLHEQMFRNNEVCGMHAMQDFLNEFVVQNSYTLLNTYEIGSNYYINCYLLPD